MPLDSTAGLAEVLRSYRLLDPGQLAEVAGDLHARFPQPRALAGELIRRDWLTPYQVNQLFAGRGESLLVGSYVVLERLGEGGMGQVFKARSRSLGRVVALKVVHRDKASQPGLAQRFVREIQACARLNHPNIVHALDAEEAGGCTFLVMEYVEGTDLERLVRARGMLPVPAACSHAAQAALGLQHAHAQGLIHRDVKPSNLLLAKDGTVKVLDLGLARFRMTLEEEEGRTLSSSLSAGSGLTQEGALMGTPDFMAPEQAEGAHAVDARADLYSLGCTLYYLLTGRPPFPGGTLIQKLRRHEREEPQPVEQQRPGVPAGLAPVLRRLMAKRPDDRYPDAGEAAAALARGEAPAVTAPLPVIPAAAACTPLPSTPTAETFAVVADFPGPSARSRERSRRRRRLVLALVVFLAAVLPAGLWFRGSGDKPAPEPKQPPTPEEELTALQHRLNAPTREAREALAQEVRAFRNRHPGTRLALAASSLLRRLPSPLDRLPPVPASERNARQPENLVAVLGEHRRRHWDAALCVAFHPGGRLLASGGVDRRVRVWEADTGRELAVLEGHTSQVGGVAFSPDGKTLASGSLDGTVRLWDVSIEPLKIEERATLKGDAREVSAVAFRPDGKTLASCGADGAVRLWNAAGAKTEERAVLRGHEGKVLALAFSPDGKTLASAGEDGTVRLWDPDTGKEGLTFRGHTAAVACLAFSPDGKTIVSGGEGRVLKRWDPVSGKETATLPPLGTVQTRAVAFSPDGGTFVTAGNGRGAVCVWDAARNVVQSVLPPVHPGPEDYYGVALDAGGRLASAADDGAVRVYDRDSLRQRHPPEGPTGPLLSLALAPDDRTLATCALEGRLWLWDLPAARLRDSRQLPAPYSLNSLAFRPPEGETLAAGDGYGVRLCDPATGKVRETLDDGKKAGRQGVIELAWSPDGKALAAAYQTGVVSLWEPGSGTPGRSWQAHRGPVPGVCFGPDGRTLASGGQDQTVRLWRDLGTEREPETWKASHQVLALALFPDGKTLAAGCCGEVMRWDVGSGGPRPALASPPWMDALAFAPDGRTLAAAGTDGELVWWDTGSGKKLGEWRAPGRFRHKLLAFASDSRHLVVGNNNGTVYILRLASVANPDE